MTDQIMAYLQGECTYRRTGSTKHSYDRSMAYLRVNAHTDSWTRQPINLVQFCLVLKDPPASTLPSSLVSCETQNARCS